MNQSNNKINLLHELFCCLILVGIVWLFVPGTVTYQDNVLHVHPDFIPLYLIGGGIVGMLVVRLFNLSMGSSAQQSFS